MLRGRLLMAGVTSACGMGFLLFGYDQGVLGGVINSPTFTQQFNHPSATLQGFMTGIYDLGCLLGSVSTFVFSERIGRKKSMYFGVFFALLGTILQTTALSVKDFIAGRVITGLGIGIMTAIVPTWQSEVSPAKQRGQLLTVQTALITTGFALSNWICLGASYATSSIQWRLPIALQAVFALYTALSVPFLVESPRWLANHRGIDSAAEVIARLHDCEVDDPRVVAVRLEIEATIELHKESTGWKWIFSSQDQNLRRMMLGVVGLYMQQMCGINSIGYYLPIILHEYIGLPPHTALILAAVGATQSTLVAYASVWVIERAGRRKCMLFGACGLAVISAMIGMGLCLHTKSSLTGAVVMYFLFYDVFNLSFLNTPWLYAPEINSLQTRVKGGAAASASNWLFNGIVVAITPIALQNIGWRFYLIFVVFNLSFIPIIYFCYPETKGLSLERINDLFLGDASGWKWLTQGVKESVEIANHRESVQIENKDSLI
ncbi:hypothetical protein ASPZODRAFT_119358 [Penicilliopsis zonata CBS 506.65]|uniref:Major facilitator superfamily (MFS) profile domain-containing protein n=1 Tax=Penicilliopsis zonata CBS 506.65 TaxID=1073090 RepID=A0A1L9SDN2_9EURO|nr:hypothetical protein ASPZODRAFT_119358 [Penicilliopsis zonata CBS 506.65]OJJ45223.1 hypothetical protein ASPZODRAFT_119358 [Penicilliopsis zonata CBS 506.65]